MPYGYFIYETAAIPFILGMWSILTMNVQEVADAAVNFQ